ncbi:MAG: ParA family protein [Promicromonosporaceae bacterium]|nr:ParA family protein [Promicromonosporaceae bacterium]
MVHVVAVANHKGGDGKTLTTTQAAGGLARRGRRVLVVDFDPQANCSRRLGWPQENPVPGISEALNADEDGAGSKVVIGCQWDQPEGELIDVITARGDLLNREKESGEPGAILRLRRALDEWISEYDYVLIDTSPSLGHLTQMAFATAQAVIIVTGLGYDAAEAAGRVEDTILKYRGRFGWDNPEIHVAGVIVNKFRTTAGQRFQLEGLVDRFGERVWDLRTTKQVASAELEVTPSYLPLWDRFAEADNRACSLSAWNDERARTTVALFDQIADRIIDTFELGAVQRRQARPLLPPWSLALR